jgi:16S rRNA (cytosine967-C5)-methyltransferase
MIHQSHLNTAVALLGAYNGDIPFSHYIKKHFSHHKKYGSKDRRQISTLCYNYFRLGHTLPASTVEEKILAGCFLCQQQASGFLEFFKPGWNAQVQLTLEEKCAIVGIEPENLFSFPALTSALAQEQNKEFCLSFLAQPQLYLRLRPGMEDSVKQKLSAAGKNFLELSSNCLALDNTTSVDEVIEPDREAVVQDLNSQLTGEFFEKYITTNNFGAGVPSVWDCCAASGGKSILLYDLFKGRVQLTVSDLRSSILHNLDLRFKSAGIKKYTSFTADLAAGGQDKYTGADKYDIIICDAPCSGSGTWARTPEQHCFFKETQLSIYAALQQKIAATAAAHLRSGGLFFYITCSVFKKENEDQVALLQKRGLELLETALLAGWNKRADSMFIAAFKAV